MGVIEIVKRGFAAANRNLALVLIFIIPGLLGNLGNIKVTAMPQTGATALISLMWGIIIVLISIFVTSGLLAVIRDYIRDGKAALYNFLSYVRKYYLKFLGLNVALFVVTMVVVFIALFFMILTLPFNSETLFIVGGFISLVVSGIGLYCVILMATMSPYIIVGEDAPIVGAIKKSVKMTRSAIAKIALLIIIFGAMSMLVAMLAVLFMGINPILVSIASSMISAYFGVVGMASFTVLYSSLSKGTA